MFFDRFAIGEWAGRGALTDLTPYLAAQQATDRDRIDLADFYDWTLREARYKPPGTSGPSRLFGLPTTIDVRVLYSNNNHLRQAGLVDERGGPRPPRNWDELRRDAVLLTRRDGGGRMTRLGFAPSFGDSWLYLYAFQAGGNLLNAAGTRVTLDSPPVVRALRYMTDVYDDLGGAQGVDGFQSGFQKDAHDPFLQNQVSMKIDGDWGMATIAQYRRDMDFQLTPAPMPQDRLDAGVKPVTWAGGSAMVIPATSRQKAGAFQLMQYLASDRGYRFVEQFKRQSYQSQGQLYLPRGQGNRRQYETWVKECVDDNPAMPASFKRGLRGAAGHPAAHADPPPVTGRATAVEPARGGVQPRGVPRGRRPPPRQPGRRGPGVPGRRATGRAGPAGQGDEPAPRRTWSGGAGTSPPTGCWWRCRSSRSS